MACRPLAVSMGNAIKSIKSCLEKMKLQPPQSEQAVRRLGLEQGRVCNFAAPVLCHKWAGSTALRCISPFASLTAYCRKASDPFALPLLPSAYLGLQAKDVLIEKVQDYLEQKIRFADRMLVKYAIEKIQVGSDGG